MKSEREFLLSVMECLTRADEYLNDINPQFYTDEEHVRGEEYTEFCIAKKEIVKAEKKITEYLKDRERDRMIVKEIDNGTGKV